MPGKGADDHQGVRGYARAVLRGDQLGGGMREGE